MTDKKWLFKLTVPVPMESNGFYESMVICAKTNAEALKMSMHYAKDLNTWTFDINRIRCQIIGDARPYMPEGIICASYVE